MDDPHVFTPCGGYDQPQRNRKAGASLAFVAFAGVALIVLPIICLYFLKELIMGRVMFSDFCGGAWELMKVTIVMFFIVFNFRRLSYALHYRSTAWYQNTGYHPWTVIKDVGLYGEYIATICEECFLRKNGVKGYVFNNVIVPKRDGDFNEIDVLSVSPLGINVIEAKARVGQFYGTLISPKWS